MSNTKTMKKAQYKQELLDTLASYVEGLDWFQISALIDQLDILVDQFANV
jgi:hypothetical protein